MNNDTPTVDDRDELIDAIENGNLPWTVDDWFFQNGRYDEPELELVVRWSPPSPVALDSGEVKNLKGLITKIESEHEDGAPITTIADAANEEFGWEVAQVSEEIDKLRSKGEVYEPKPDHLRTT